MIFPRLGIYGWKEADGDLLLASLLTGELGRHEPGVGARDKGSGRCPFATTCRDTIIRPPARREAGSPGAAPA